MGDYATRKKRSDTTPTVGAPGMESFWAGVATGATRSLVDPHVPGTSADPGALLPYIDHARDHDDDPIAMANSVTAQLRESTRRAKAFTSDRAQRYVDALVAALEHTDERDARYKVLNALDRLDEPALRDSVLAKFQAQTGRPLSDVLATADWYSSRDAAQAQALISPARAKVEREIAALPPDKRAELQAEARKTATEIANVVGRSSPNDKANAQRLHRTLAGKTPMQIEAIRAAVREQSRGNESLYEQIDRSLSGGNEDEALASLTGDPVYTASVALQNAAGDAPRIVEILHALTLEQRETLKQRYPAATLVWMSVPHDQQAEIGALVNGDRHAANGAKVADLFRDPMHGADMDGLELDEQTKRNREQRSTANILRELATMSPEDLAKARHEWDTTAPARGEKTWDAMIEERFGSGDPMTYMRIRALVAGNKVEAAALALSQGVRDHDQATIDSALANPDLSSSDPAKREAAREHARAVAARFQQIQTANQVLVAGAHGDVASARGDNVDTALANHYAHVGATQTFDSASDVTDLMLAPQKQAARRKKRAHDAEVGTDELREHGAFSTATEIHRARANGDEGRVATLLEGQRDKTAVNNVDSEYFAKYGEELFTQVNTDEVTALRDFHALRGVEISRSEAEQKLRGSDGNRVWNVHESGPRAVRSNATQLRYDREERDRNTSDELGASDLMNKVVFGRAAGSQERLDWALANEADAVDAAKTEFDQHAIHTRSMSDMQRDEKIALGESAAQWISILGKIAALATLNPTAMLVIDTLVGFATIYVKGEIQGEAYTTAGADLLDTGLTVLNDLAMMPILKIESSLVRTAAMLGLSSGTIIVRNDLSGRGAETNLDLIKNLLLTLVVNPGGDKLQDSVGGIGGKTLNVLANAVGNGAAYGGDVTTLIDAGGGHLAKRPGAHHPSHLARQPHARSSHPDVIASGHYAEDADAPTTHEAYRGDRTASGPVEVADTRPAKWHPDADRNAALERHAKREGHSGVDLHNHFMGVVSVDDFAAEMGETGPDDKKRPLTSEQLLLKIRDAVRTDPDFAAHYDGDQAFDDTGGAQGKRGGDAFNNVKAIEDAQAAIDELRRGPQGPDTEAKIRRIADDAVHAALNASKHTPFDGGYSIRDAVVKKHIDPQPYNGPKVPFSNYIRMTLKALERDGVLYSEQSQSVNKLAKGNITPEAVATGLAAINKERADKGLPPMDVRFLAMIETKFLGAGGDPATADAKWDDQLKNLRALMARGDVIGVDIAAPETSDMTAGGAQMQHRMRDLALMLQAEGHHRGRKLVLRPHVGEGYIEMPNNEHGHKAPFDADHSRAHYEKAQANLWAMVDAVERLSKTIGPDGKPIYNPADPNPEIRLGHATHATPELAMKLKELGIVVEVNLGSNAVSGSLQDSATNPQGRSASGHLHYMDDHSLLTLVAAGVRVVLATDGQGVMSTQLRDEHKRAAQLLEGFRWPESDKTMPVTREIYAAAKRLSITDAVGPYVLTYRELPNAMRENVDSAYARMTSEAANRADEVARDDAGDNRRGS